MAEKNDDLGGLIEAKLTKGEAIDLLIGEMKEELRQEIARLDEREKEIDAQFKLDGPMMAALEGARLRVHASYRNDKMANVSLDTDLAADRLPAHVRKLYEERTEVERQKRRAESRLHQFDDKNKTDARNIILRSLLEVSDEGRRFLRAIESIRLKARPKILALQGR